MRPITPKAANTSVLGSGSDRKPEEVEKHICHRAALKAYNQAGVGPQDMSVAEVHDARRPEASSAASPW